MLRQANDHAVMPGLGLGFIGAAELIPNGKIKTVITIGLILDNGMMHAVHIGRDDDSAQGFVEAKRELEISVIKYC